MKTAFIRATAGAALIASGFAGAQTYSTHPSSSYGYSNATGIVRCESVNSRTNFCRVDTRGGVQLYRQLSRENCIRGRNWQVRNDGIVVDNGCRAEFAIGTAYQAGSRTIIGTDRYGRPVYGTGNYNGGYSTDRYGRPVYGTGTYNGGYATDRYGRPIYDHRTSGYGYGNGGYATDRYGRPIYDHRTSGYGYGNGGYSSGGYSNGGYAIDRNGNRVYVGSGGVYDDGYTYDQYGNRVNAGTSGGYGSGGYYATDRYGNRVWVQQSGTGRVYDDDYDTADRVYDNNQAMGYPGTTPVYNGYPQVEVVSGGTTSSSTTYATGAIHCQPAATGRTYCGDRTRTYTMKYDAGATCALNRTYGRDSGGFWVAAGCSMTLEPSKY